MDQWHKRGSLLYIRMVSIYDIVSGACKIAARVSEDGPFFIGRHGTIEIEVIASWLTENEYSPRLKEQIQMNAGVFPATRDSVDAWCRAYVNGLELLDGGAAGWFPPTAAAESQILDSFAPKAFRTPLRSLEPYYVGPSQRWTRYLAGKKVAVVSSFADTIRKQLWGERTCDIWKDGLLNLSGTEWSFVRTGYSPAIAQGRAAWPGCYTWQEAVKYVVDEVLKTGSEVALIGCGGLGMIIGAELKRRGVSAIVLGGAIQVLFGIKGNRWATHDVISKFWNDAWVWPAADEIPAGASRIERGCYWGP
jgi:hypothetical protein